MSDDPSSPSREPVTVVLTEVDGGTEMTMTQSGGNLTEKQYAQTVIGYNGFFDAMEKLLAAQAAGLGGGAGETSGLVTQGATPISRVSPTS